MSLLSQIQANTTSVVNGKQSIIDKIEEKGGTVTQAGNVVTFSELCNGIDTIQGGSGGGYENLGERVYAHLNNTFSAGQIFEGTPVTGASKPSLSGTTISDKSTTKILNSEDCNVIMKSDSNNVFFLDESTNTYQEVVANIPEAVTSLVSTNWCLSQDGTTAWNIFDQTYIDGWKGSVLIYFIDKENKGVTAKVFEEVDCINSIGSATYTPTFKVLLSLGEYMIYNSRINSVTNSSRIKIVKYDSKNDKVVALDDTINLLSSARYWNYQSCGYDICWLDKINGIIGAIVDYNIASSSRRIRIIKISIANDTLELLNSIDIVWGADSTKLYINKDYTFLLGSTPGASPYYGTMYKLDLGQGKYETKYSSSDLASKTGISSANYLTIAMTRNDNKIIAGNGKVFDVSDMDNWETYYEASEINPSLNVGSNRYLITDSVLASLERFIFHKGTATNAMLYTSTPSEALYNISTCSNPIGSLQAGKIYGIVPKASNSGANTYVNKLFTIN